MKRIVKTIFYVVNVDYFFISHRLPLAIEAIGRGYVVHVFAKNSGILKDLEKYGIIVHNLPMGRGIGSGFFDLLSFFKLSYFYLRFKPSVLHHVTAKAVIYGTIAAGLFNNKAKVVNSVTGLGYTFIQENQFFVRFVTLSLLKIASFIAPKTTYFIFQNIDDKNIYINSGITQMIFSRIISGSGVDEKHFILNPNTRNEDGIVVVTFLGRMLKDKGVREFVKAALLLKEKLFGKVFFQLVGGIDLGNPAALSESEIRNWLVNNYLVWEGYRTDVKEVYQNTHIACLPSYREGLPKSLIEAMAMSCAIITTDTPGCRECVDDGVNGFLVPVGDWELLAKRVLELVIDCQKRKDMGRASRKKMLNNMSLSSVVEQTFAIYEG